MGVKEVGSRLPLPFSEETSAASGKGDSLSPLSCALASPSPPGQHPPPKQRLEWQVFC